MDLIDSSKKLISTRSSDSELIGQHCFKVSFAGFAKLSIPLFNGVAVNRSVQNLALECLKFGMNNPVHLRKVRVEPIWQSSE